MDEVEILLHLQQYEIMISCALQLKKKTTAFSVNLSLSSVRFIGRACKLLVHRTESLDYIKSFLTIKLDILVHNLLSQL